MLSGPPPASSAARWAGGLDRPRNLITFDMGGTRADIGIVGRRRASPRPRRATRRSPATRCSSPMFDIQTIGAGGGSIAYVDAAGALPRRPAQRRAPTPGPACYGRGGEEPTITDAHLVLGRLDPERFLGGEMPLDPTRPPRRSSALAERLGIEPARRPPRGSSARQRQDGADRSASITVERGHDPRDFASSRSAARARCTPPSSPTRLGDRRGRDPAAPGHHVRRRAC